uniref:Protein tyrosine phosphatase n=1 Tax=Panagrolaimus sp. JU765 TaxID=591449 RepID=A0AC34Q7N4_9BILA
MPYEDTRIMLHPTKKNKHGYINASNIQIPINDRLFKYILTQNPLKTTIDDFYQMIWESDTRIVISFMDKNESHAEIYWPTKINEKLSIGDFSIRQQSSTITKGLTTTILNVKCLSSGEKRIIYHLNFTAFKKDLDGVPANIETFLSFVDAVNSFKRHIENEKMHDGDSGVFIPSLFNSRKNSYSRSRSKSTTRSTFMDVTNKIRSQSVEQVEQGNRWKRKFITNPTNQQSTSSNTSEISGISSTSNSSSGSTSFRTEYLEQQNPIIVHCMDGSSISGLYVLIEVIVHCIENNVNVEIPKLLRLLRQQRSSLIKNIHQYKFAYEAILVYLQRSRLI